MLKLILNVNQSDSGFNEPEIAYMELDANTLQSLIDYQKAFEAANTIKPCIRLSAFDYTPELIQYLAPLPTGSSLYYLPDSDCITLLTDNDEIPEDAEQLESALDIATLLKESAWDYILFNSPHSLDQEDTPEDSAPSADSMRIDYLVAKVDGKRLCWEGSVKHSNDCFTTAELEFEDLHTWLASIDT